MLGGNVVTVDSADSDVKIQVGGDIAGLTNTTTVTMEASSDIEEFMQVALEAVLSHFVYILGVYFVYELRSIIALRECYHVDKAAIKQFLCVRSCMITCMNENSPGISFHASPIGNESLKQLGVAMSPCVSGIDGEQGGILVVA